MPDYTDFESEVKAFEKYVQSERLKQYDRYLSSSEVLREAERQKLVSLNNINTKPSTREDLEYLKLMVQDISELDASKIKTGLHGQENLCNQDNPKKDHYYRDLNIAFFGPPFFLCFLPIILIIICVLTCGLSGCNGCWFEDLCFSGFMFYWILLIPIISPFILLFIIPCTNAVNKKYGKEKDDFANGVLIASAIGCAVSNMKQTKKSVKNLLNQNGKTEV